MLVPDQDAATALQASVEHPVLLWFLVVLAVTLQTSFLTPPVGFSLFYMHGAAPSLRLSDIYRGVVPFILLQLLVVMSVLCWPQLVLWLPSPALILLSRSLITDSSRWSSPGDLRRRQGSHHPQQAP